MIKLFEKKNAVHCNCQIVTGNGSWNFTVGALHDHDHCQWHHCELVYNSMELEITIYIVI